MRRARCGASAGGVGSARPASAGVRSAGGDPRSPVAAVWGSAASVVPRPERWTWQGITHDTKINAAFSIGGVKASLHVVAGLLHIPINYVVDISFTAFDKIVDKLGCVYVDVDHLYYNPPGDGFASIDVRPGYQRVCGQQSVSQRLSHLARCNVKAKF